MVKRKHKRIVSMLIMVAMFLLLSTSVFAATVPTGLSGYAVSGAVNLNWNDTVDGKYYVYRSTDDVTYTKLSSLLLSSNYVDSTAVNGTTYHYKVTSYDGTAESAQSAKVTFTPSATQVLFSGLTTGGISTNATDWASNFDNLLLVAVGIGVAFACVRFVVRLF